MREIKFRVWNEVDKCWDHGDHGGHGVFEWSNGFLKCKYSDDTDDYTVQQYTGLQDSRGKDIYEGDFLRWQYPETFEELRIVEVRWKEKDYVGWSTTDSIDQYGECEIVGNIFENPEFV